MPMGTGRWKGQFDTDEICEKVDNLTKCLRHVGRVDEKPLGRRPTKQKVKAVVALWKFSTKGGEKDDS